MERCDCPNPLIEPERRTVCGACGLPFVLRPAAPGVEPDESLNEETWVAAVRARWSSVHTRWVAAFVGALLAALYVLAHVSIEVQRHAEAEAREAAQLEAERRGQVRRQAERQAAIDAMPKSQVQARGLIAKWDRAAASGDDRERTAVEALMREMLGRHLRASVSIPREGPRMEARLEVGAAWVAVEAGKDMFGPAGTLLAGDLAPAGGAELLAKASSHLAGVPEGTPGRPELVDQIARLQRDHRHAIAEAQRLKEQLVAAESLCGEAPTPDTWDRGIAAIETHFEVTAHDPGSIDVENCSAPVLTEGCWATTCVVRGKNALGALVATGQLCLLKQAGPSRHVVLACEQVE